MSKLQSYLCVSSPLLSLVLNYSGFPSRSGMQRMKWDWRNKRERAAHLPAFFHKWEVLSSSERQSPSLSASTGQMDAFDLLWLWSISHDWPTFLSLPFFLRWRSPPCCLCLIACVRSSGWDQWPPSVRLVATPCPSCLNVPELALPFPLTPQAQPQNDGHCNGPVTWPRHSVPVLFSVSLQRCCRPVWPN